MSEPLRSPAFCFEADMSDVETCAFAGGTVAYLSAKSPDKASPNEDSMAIIPTDDGAGVLAVADGVGGVRGGECASKVALVELVQAIQNADRSSDGWIRGAILDGIENANRAVLALDGGATTLAIVEVSGRTVRSYHVGDSMVLVTGQRGRVKHEVVAHSPVGYAQQAGLLGEEEAMVHEDRNLIDNMIGAQDMRIEIGPSVELALRDTLVLASDGLSDNLYATEIIDTVRKGELARAGRALFETCRARMAAPDGDHPSKADDLTFAVFRFLADEAG